MNQIEDISIPILIINPHNKSRVKVEDILKIKKSFYFIKFIDDENGLYNSQNIENNKQFLKLI